MQVHLSDCEPLFETGTALLQNLVKLDEGLSSKGKELPDVSEAEKKGIMRTVYNTVHVSELLKR